MNPAAAMGTFLRTWRAEWAGLSRAQLAIAVNQKHRNGRRLSEQSVRRWEEGQPPKNTEELEALSEVMRERGLFPVEIEQFRQAVFAACADRQFPELFTHGDWVYSEDVDARARALKEQWALPASPVSIVDLVASVEELARVVHDDPRPRPTPAQRQKQRAALAHLRARLVVTTSRRSGRSAYVAQLCLQQTALLEAHFSDRPLVREWEVDEWRMYHEVNMAPTRGPRSVQTLFALVEDAEQRIHPGYAAWVFCCTLGALKQGTQAQREYAWQAAPKYAAAARDNGMGSLFDWMLSYWALRMGHVAEAEPLLEPFQCWRGNPNPEAGLRWARRMAQWARATEDYPAALGYLEKHLAYCRRLGHPEEGIVASIAQCEDACRSANHRKRRNGSSLRPDNHTNVPRPKRAR